MKKIKYISILFSFLLLFVGCEKVETEDISSILHFELNGDIRMLVPLGTSYKEPGVTVTYKGQDVSSSIEIFGNVDTKTVGIYNLDYIYTNADGVKTTRSRNVIVADPGIKTDISGKYTGIEGTQRLRKGVTTPYPGFTVIIKKVAPGFFQISDFFGGYYAQRAGYGNAYACNGYIQLKSDNTLTLLSNHVSGWGDSLSALNDGVCDPEKGSISWKAEYKGMTFTVVLNKE